MFVENLSRLVSTPSVTAANGGFEVAVEASLSDRLLLHALLDGQNEVVIELTLFLTADGRGAHIDDEAGASFTTLDGSRSGLIRALAPASPWTPREDSLVRSLPPHEAARRTGKPWQAVLRRRRELGLQDRWGSPWSAEETALLGKDSDAAIAARLGITPQAVRHRRVKLGIPARWRGRPPASACR